MTFVTRYDHAVDPAFQHAVIVAIVQRARERMASSAPDIEKKAALALMRHPDEAAYRFALAAVANPTIAQAVDAGTPISDGDLEYVIDQLITTFAWQPAETGT